MERRLVAPPHHSQQRKALARLSLSQTRRRRRRAALSSTARAPGGLGALEEGAALCTAFVETSPVASFIKDEAGRYLYVNTGALQRLGTGQSNWLGKTDGELWPADTAEQLRNHDRAVFEAVGPLELIETLPAADGSVGQWFVVKFTFVSASGQRLLGGMTMEIREGRGAEGGLAYQVLHDAVTDLPNRLLLHERLTQALLVAHRENMPLALLLMDLDRFREVNDTLGHHVGDVLLQQVGARVSHVLRTSDTVARLGGDEFGILLPAIADAAGATMAATKILARIEEPFVVEGHHLDMRASVGIALGPEHGEDVHTLLRHADVAMYVAKRAESGYAVYTAEHDQYSPGRLALGGELRQAIEDDGLRLYYQPKVEVATGTVRGVEALARWPHPRHGFIPPDQFIPLAEQIGLIKPLSLWALDTALSQCRAWLTGGLTLDIAVNLSTRSLQSLQLIDDIAALLAKHHVPGRSLTVEITESAIMADPTQAREILTRLSALGVRVAIDDFGTGYSSLSYLNRLPVDELKIDKSFVQDVMADGSNVAIIRSIVGLGHTLNLKVVAEGVETDQARLLMHELGCDLAQGYYFARPLPASELTAFVTDAQRSRKRSHAS